MTVTTYLTLHKRTASGISGLKCVSYHISAQCLGNEVYLINGTQNAIVVNITRILWNEGGGEPLKVASN